MDSVALREWLHVSEVKLSPPWNFMPVWNSFILHACFTSLHFGYISLCLLFGPKAIIFALRWFQIVQSLSKLFPLVSKEGPSLIMLINSFSQFVFALVYIQIFCNNSIKLGTCLALPYNGDVSKYCCKNHQNLQFFSPSHLSQLSIQSHKNKLNIISCMFFFS